MEQRLQKLLASAGIASRRSSEELIARGKVTVNGVIISEPGAKADPERDDIRVSGKPLPKPEDHVYILLNKPTGYVSTVKDPHAPQTVMQLVKDVSARLYPVGRLDADSAGLLLLTNDGGFAKLLTHPSHEVPKTYRAVVRGKVLGSTIQRLAQGITLEDGVTMPAEVQFVEHDSANNASVVDITIHEGRKRQVRRMFLSVHHPVLALTRIRIGSIQLRGLPPGKWRKLHPAEVTQLREMAESARTTAGRRGPDTGGNPERNARPDLGDRRRNSRTRIPRESARPTPRESTIPESTAAAKEAAAEITRRLRAGRPEQAGRPPRNPSASRRKPRAA